MRGSLAIILRPAGMAGTRPVLLSEQAFLAYHPIEDRWEQLPMPETALDGVAIGDAGDQLVLYQHSHENGVATDWVFDPRTGDWSELPDDPLRPSFDRTMVWTGTDLVVLGIEVVPQPGSESPAFYQAAVYDTATGSWARLPDSEVIGWSPIWYWAAGRIISPSVGSSDGGEVNNYGRFYPHGGMLDPATGTWEPLPKIDDYQPGFSGPATASAELLMDYSGWVLDAAAGQWFPVSAPPNSAQQGSAAAWAGDELIVWGGIRWEANNSQLLDTGWILRPDR